MKINHFFALLIICISLNSCINTVDGNGKIVSEEREVSDFNKIDIAGAYEVFISQGNQEKIELSADENLMEYIETDVKGKTLKISSQENLNSDSPLEVYITIKNLEEITTSGAVEITSKEQLKLDELAVDASGASELDISILTSNLEIEMSGASETKLDGEADNLSIEISGAGELNAKALKTNNTSIDISGAGSAVVFAKESLKIEVSGAGSVQYKGDPKVKKSISGAGSVTKL